MRRNFRLNISVLIFFFMISILFERILSFTVCCHNFGNVKNYALVKVTVFRQKSWLFKNMTLRTFAYTFRNNFTIIFVLRRSLCTPFPGRVQSLGNLRCFTGCGSGSGPKWGDRLDSSVNDWPPQLQ